MKRSTVSAIIVLILILASGIAFGEELAVPKAAPPAFSVPQTMGPIITDYATPIGKGKIGLHTNYFFNFAYGAFDRNWQRKSAGGNYLGAVGTYKIIYGITDELEVYGSIPLIHNRAGSVNVPGPTGERNSSFPGFGDLDLTFKYQLIKETENLPSVSATMGLNFPTGHFTRLNPGRLGTDQLGSGSFGFVPGVVAQKYFEAVPMILYGGLTYAMNTSFTAHGADANGVPASFRFHPRDTINVNFAAEFPIHKQWVPFVEFIQSYGCGRLIGHKGNNPPGANIAIMPGIQFLYNEHLTFAAGMKAGLIGKNGRADIGPFFAAQYYF